MKSLMNESELVSKTVSVSRSLISTAPMMPMIEPMAAPISRFRVARFSRCSKIDDAESTAEAEKDRVDPLKSERLNEICGQRERNCKNRANYDNIYDVVLFLALYIHRPRWAALA